jgi:hypothetical protein
MAILQSDSPFARSLPAKTRFVHLVIAAQEHIANGGMGQDVGMDRGDHPIVGAKKWSVTKQNGAPGETRTPDPLLRRRIGTPSKVMYYSIFSRLSPPPSGQEGTD